MAQQQAIYDKSCELIVSRTIHAPGAYLTRFLGYRFDPSILPSEFYSPVCQTAYLSVLNSCRRAQGAEHYRGSRHSCLRGTRETALDKIESWAKDFAQSPVFRLNGLAGTGKSTITQTVSKQIFADG